jgi:hypothetical protein
MRSSARCVTVLMAWLLAGVGAPARADDDDMADADTPALVAELLTPPVLTDAPRLTRSDTPALVSRGLPGFRTDMTELNYRWWSTRGRTDVGVGLGSVMLVERPTEMLSARPGVEGASPMTTASGTVLMLGLRYRASPHAALYADASNVRGLGLNNDDRVYGKVGVEFKAARSKWNIAYGGLGYKLDGDARMTLRLRRGGLGIYMTSAF